MIYWTDFYDCFHQMEGQFEFYRPGPLSPIPQGMLPWQPILSKIGELTFIQHAGVPKQIRISQFRFADIKWQ